MFALLPSFVVVVAATAFIVVLFFLVISLRQRLRGVFQINLNFTLKNFFFQFYVSFLFLAFIMNFFFLHLNLLAEVKLHIQTHGKNVDDDDDDRCTQ